MDLFYFTLKYTPFWAIPIIMICVEFAYVYWLKSIKNVSKTFMLIGLIAAAFLGYYVYTGGPDGVVEKTIEAQEVIGSPF